MNISRRTTLHRRTEMGDPLLIRVDLIRARFDPRETVLVQPGDIIYMNPDSGWYSRRLFDKVVTQLILVPYNQVLAKAIFGVN